MCDLGFSLEGVMNQFIASNVEVLGISSKGSGGFENDDTRANALSVGNELYRPKSFKHLGFSFHLLSFYS